MTRKCIEKTRFVVDLIFVVTYNGDKGVDLMTIRERMDRLLEENNLTQIELLIKLIEEVEPDNLDNYMSQEANFSKMINGERRFKYTFIAPMERILQTNFDYILNGREGDMFVNKGIRYVAYKDEYSMYEKLDSKEIEPYNTLLNYDEYENNILDYILEYESFNGVSYLIKNSYIEMAIGVKGIAGAFMGDLSTVESINKIIIDNDDYSTFDKLYKDSFRGYKFFQRNNELLLEDKSIQSILATKNIFKGLLKTEEFDLEVVNPGLLSRGEKSLYFNPLIKEMFEYTLKNIDLYETKLIDIIDFGIKHNTEVYEYFNNNFDYNINFEIGTNGYIYDFRTDFKGITIYGSTLNYLGSEIENKFISEKLMELIKSYNSLESLFKSKIEINKLREDNELGFLKTDYDKDNLEKQFYKIMKMQGYSKVPVFSERSIDGKDNYQYQLGDLVSDISDSKMTNVLKEFIKIEELSKDKINGEIYLYGFFNKHSFMFDGDEVVSIIGWENIKKGKKNDNIYSLMAFWFSFNAFKVDDALLFYRFKKLLNSIELKGDIIRELPEKIIKMLEFKTNTLTNGTNEYNKYSSVLKYMILWLKIYDDKIKELVTVNN